MAITSSDIQNQSFSIDRKGYDVDEVDVFLEHVANEIDEMNATIQQLESDLDGGKYSGYGQRSSGGDAEMERELAEKDRYIADLERQIEEKKADDNAIAQALIIAQRSADDIIADANAEAQHIHQDAEDEAQRILDKANNEKQRIINDIKQLEDDREDTRGEYQDILKEFIDDASKKLTSISSKEPSQKSSAHAKSHEGSASRSRNQAPIRRESGSAIGAYTTPQTSATSVVVPTTPRPSKVEKDLSGFGDADDTFELGDID